MPDVTYAAVVLLVTGAATYAVIVYNGLVRLQNEIGRAWANIDVLLKQRHDEIPNLVACVKGYMDHERLTLEAVTQARAASMIAASIPQKAQADLLVTGALRSFFGGGTNAAMRITEVVHGADLLKSTARQLLLIRALGYAGLGYAAPDYFHCALVRDAAGVRLAKRHDALSIRHLRESGMTGEKVLEMAGWP